VRRSTGVAAWVVGFLALAGLALPAGAQQFTTADGRIYAPNGQEFVARGVNLPGFNYWTNQDPTPHVSKVVDDWKFNMVRVVNQPLSGGRPGANINLDNVINAYTARGVVTMVELHESTGTYLEGAQLTTAANWFAGLAEKYKNNPYVWFNTANEPGGRPVDGAKWLTMNRTIINAIRAKGANNVVVADGTNFGQDQWWDDQGNLNPAHSAILSFGPTLANEYGNVVFDTHIYGEWSSTNAISSRLPKYIQATRAANLPLIFGEYGAKMDGTWLGLQTEFLKVANQYGVGRAAWAWADDGAEWQLTTSSDPNAVGKAWQYGGGYLINSSTNPTNLTAFGQLVWNDTHAAPVPEPAVAGGVALLLAGATLRRRRRAA
jgi:hypothetical protein